LPDLASLRKTRSVFRQETTPMISLAELQRRISSGKLSADAAIAQSVEATDALEKKIGAFAFRAEAVRPASSGPLRGITVGIKDIIDTSDLPTEMGSSIYKGWRPRADASVVMMLKQAGATIIGKTTTTAFAANDPTATRNPRNLEHTPGGSSSGSAAAVAAGMIPLALGTQTGGSVIRPASFCGVAAIKPSFHLLPKVGVKCFSWTLDTVGLFAAGVEDLARGLAAMTNRPELLPAATVNAPRIILPARRTRRPKRRCGSRVRRPSAPAHRFPRWHCRRFSPRRGGFIPRSSNSRRIRPSPGNIARTTMRCRRCCAKGWTKARISPRPTTTRRAGSRTGPDVLWLVSSSRSTSC
jgi:hypothetical protein